MPIRSGAVVEAVIPVRRSTLGADDFEGALLKSTRFRDFGLAVVVVVDELFVGWGEGDLLALLGRGT